MKGSEASFWECYLRPHECWIMPSFVWESVSWPEPKAGQGPISQLVEWTSRFWWLIKSLNALQFAWLSQAGLRTEGNCPPWATAGKKQFINTHTATWNLPCWVKILEFLHANIFSVRGLNLIPSVRHHFCVCFAILLSSIKISSDNASSCLILGCSCLTKCLPWAIMLSSNKGTYVQV